jgi:hypothetical protein
VVTLSAPNIISSAARPPIIVSIIANILDLVTWYSSFAGMYAVYNAISNTFYRFNSLYGISTFKTKSLKIKNK